MPLKMYRALDEGLEDLAEVIDDIKDLITDIENGVYPSPEIEDIRETLDMHLEILTKLFYALRRGNL